MNREVWLAVKSWNKAVVMDAIELGFTGILVAPEHVPRVRELAVIKVIAEDPAADLVLGSDIFELHLDQANAKETLKAYARTQPVILYSDDWRVIPMEALVSREAIVIQHVRSHQEAKLSFETLERGANGILLETDSLEEVRRVGQLIMSCSTEDILLDVAQVTSVAQVGVGARVAVDFCSVLEPGRGLLVGNSSTFLFLVQNENLDNPYCDKRPFRVNAGGVHSYVLMPSDETKYLAELETGYTALTVNPQGEARPALVGRCKVEYRSMLLVGASVGGRSGSILVQNAETVRLTRPDGGTLSVTQIRQGAEILVAMDDLSFGRHFGRRIKETIEET